MLTAEETNGDDVAETVFACFAMGIGDGLGNGILLGVGVCTRTVVTELGSIDKFKPVFKKSVCSKAGDETACKMVASKCSASAETELARYLTEASAVNCTLHL